MVFAQKQGECMRRKARHILGKVREEISKHNVKLKLTNNYKIICESEKCYGYFIPPEKKKKGQLAIAIGEKRHVDYLWDLAHELAHFRQWKRDDPTYLKHMSDSSSYSLLEQKTEKEAKKIFLNWGFKISNRLQKRSEKYLKTLRE